MEHHVEISVWVLVWCLWVFCYTILSLQLYLMELWANENVVHNDNDDDTYLIQFWLSEDIDDNDNNE